MHDLTKTCSLSKDLALSKITQKYSTFSVSWLTNKTNHEIHNLFTRGKIVINEQQHKGTRDQRFTLILKAKKYIQTHWLTEHNLSIGLKTVQTIISIKYINIKIITIVVFILYNFSTSNKL